MHRRWLCSGTALDHRLVRQAAATFLFFGSLAIIYNPFIALPEAVRFSVFLAMQAVAALLFFGEDDLERLREPRWPAVAFVVLYLVALLRLNPVDSEVPLALQGLLTLATFMLAWLTSNRLSVTVMRRVLLLSLLPASSLIMFNFNLLNDYAMRDWVQLGTFSYDNYQYITFVLALVGLAALGEVDGPNVKSLALVGLFLLIGYFIFQGLARGEAVAFAVAAMMIVAPRITLLAAPFSLILLELATRTFETPLTVRLRLVLEGDYSMRDELYAMAGQMLAEQPWLLFTGGGLAAFQSHYNLAAGYYPHNMLIEALLVGGIPLALAMVFLFVVPPVKFIIGSFRGRLTKEGRYSLALMCFLVLIAMKSGTLSSMWTLMLFAGVFIRAGDAKNTKERRIVIPRMDAMPLPQSRT